MSLRIRLEFCIDLSRISVNRDSAVGFVWSCPSIENPQHCVAVCEFTDTDEDNDDDDEDNDDDDDDDDDDDEEEEEEEEEEDKTILEKICKTWRAASASSRAGLAADSFFSATALSA